MEGLNKFFDKTTIFFSRIFSAVIPSGKELSITLGCQFVFLVLFWLWLTLVLHEPNRYWFFSPGIFILGILGAILAGLIAAALIKAFQFIPYLFLASIAFALVISIYVTSSIANTWQMVLTVNLWLVLPPILIGFGSAYIKKQEKGKVIYRIIGWFFLASGMAAVIFGIIWILSPGFSDQDSLPQVIDARSSVPILEVENPAKRGMYTVLTLTYGSGSDKNREAFSGEAALITDSVDASVFLPTLEKFPGWLYKLQWGFDKTNLPINGRVWYPQGEGPFPLVLLVHGNHTALDYSEEGYAYLAELLASRGMIVVSVDENFLNSTWINAISDDYSHQENDARGWLLLQHLEQFRKWDSNAGTPFYKKINWNKIALVGHSRGGEAITEAANFNALGTYPDNGNISFPKPFNIKALIAIAPVDNQYNPASKDTPIENVDYLVIQGSADADLKNFPGQAAYSRVAFTDTDEYHFKSSVYLHRANHGQFNTSWGEADNGKLSYFLLDRSVLLDENTQQQTAQVIISAFLEASLNHNGDYVSFFRDTRCGRNWLPEVTIWTQFADSNDMVILDFEEDIDLHTGTFPNSEISARHFDSWRESILYGNRNRAIADSVLSLSWNNQNSQTSEYKILFSEPIAMNQYEFLVFSAAAESDYENAGDKIIPTNFSITISDGKHSATITTDRYALLYKNPVLSLNKAAFMNSTSGSESILQTIQIPIDEILAKNLQLDLANVTSITFAFDQNPQGKIWLDNVAVR